MLTWLDKQDLSRNLEREQFHLFVGESHGGRDHLAVVQQEPDNVGRRAVELGRELLRRNTALDDNDALGYRCI